MKRQQLEHILRAAHGITGADRFVVIGSQAILGQFADPPADLLVSIEADLFSLRNPQDAELIDGSIGEASPFHQTFGYYAHGVGEETAVLPNGWKERLVPLTSAVTGGATGLCLEVHDLGVSKLVAGARRTSSLSRDCFGIIWLILRKFACGSIEHPLINGWVKLAMHGLRGLLKWHRVNPFPFIIHQPQAAFSSRIGR